MLQKNSASSQLDFAATLHHSQHFSFTLWYKNAGSQVFGFEFVVTEALSAEFTNVHGVTVFELDWPNFIHRIDIEIT